jgi:hypothetical protein
MAIRLGEEELLSLAAAARRLPKKNSGKAVHVAALYRWAATGYRGIVLETLQVGGQRFTSMGALQRFAEALTDQDNHQGGWREVGRPTRNESAIARAEAEVSRLLSVK